MKSLSKVLAAAAASMMVAGTAVAADVNPVMIPAVQATTPPPAPTFNWNRFYVGTYGGAWFDIGPFGFDTLRTGLRAGYNYQISQFVLGAGVEVGVYDFSGLVFEIYGTGRAGFLVTPNLLLYALAGLGYDTDFGGAMMLGGGVELAVSQNLTVRFEGTFWRELGTPFDYVSLTGGLNWYVGN